MPQRFLLFVGVSLIPLAVWPSTSSGGGTVSVDAQKLQQSAVEAYSEKNFPLAIQRFREVIGKYAQTASIHPARYGLALCWIEGHDKNYVEALELLQALPKEVPGVDPLQVTYWKAAATRGHGYGEMALAVVANPKDAAKHRAAAEQHFLRAADLFAQSRAGFLQRAGKWPRDAKVLPADVEWAALATCDLAECDLRAGQYKWAQQETQVFVDGAGWVNSKHRNLGRYYHGFASFMLKDFAGAERSLSMLAPWTDPRFGNHSRYLLARLHHQSDERTEATYHYDGVLADFTREKKEAQALLKQPAMLAKDPVLKVLAENIARDPPPDHVIRVFFYSAVLFQEAGRFADAKDRFLAFTKIPPAYPLTNEALLRLGICQVYLKEGQAALNTLQPLIDRDPAVKDQVLLWMARGAVQAVPDANLKVLFEKSVKRVVDLYEQCTAALEAKSKDAQAKVQLGEVMLEMTDALLQFKRPKEAVKACEAIVAKNLLPARPDEVSFRLAVALHLAGDFDLADQECERFFAKHPQSRLLPQVWFRYAENSWFRTLAAEHDAKQKDNLAKLRGETIKRYTALIQGFPSFPQLGNARFAIGQLHFRLGDFAKAQATLDAIPQAERTGELAMISYLVADCVWRQVPAGVPEDALAAGKLEAQLKQIAEQLDSFVSAQPNAPQTPEALIRLGQALQRLASLQVQVGEKNKLYTDARAAFDKVLVPQFNGYPALQAQALMERARCRALYGGDINKSMTELRQFLADPLKKTTAAPLAVMQLTVWLRSLNRASEAAGLIAKFTDEYGQRPNADPVMRGLLAFHHGMALKEANQLGAAKTTFETAMQLIADRPEGIEAALRWAQCRRAECNVLADQASRLMGSGNKQDQDKGKQLLVDIVAIRTESIDKLTKTAGQFKEKQGVADTVARLYFEAAWLHRELAEHELQLARTAALAAWHKKMGAKARLLPQPEFAMADLPVQPSEKKALACYLELIDAFADLPLALDARLELAEYLTFRHQYADATKHLVEALDREPSPEMTTKVRFLLGVCHAARGNHKAAVIQFDLVGQTLKSFLAAQAKYRAAECSMKTKDYQEAIKRFTVFRDTPQFQELPGLSDMALLRMGHAHLQMQQWDAAVQDFTLLIQRHASSRLTGEAHFGLGWAHEQKQQWQPAADAYRASAEHSPQAEIGAKALVRCGVCRMAQKQFKEAADIFLSVPTKYGFDEWNGVALLEAADAFVQLKQIDVAHKTLQRVIVEYPNSPAAQAAQLRLEKLGK